MTVGELEMQVTQIIYESQYYYILPTKLEFAIFVWRHLRKHKYNPKRLVSTTSLWCSLGDSNPGPSGYEPGALTN